MTVAMESTGVYWIPPHEILEEAGLRVCLVNSKHVKARARAQDGRAGLPVVAVSPFGRSAAGFVSSR